MYRYIARTQRYERIGTLLLAIIDSFNQAYYIYLAISMVKDVTSNVLLFMLLLCCAVSIGLDALIIQQVFIRKRFLSITSELYLAYAVTTSITMALEAVNAVLTGMSLSDCYMYLAYEAVFIDVMYRKYRTTEELKYLVLHDDGVGV